MNRFKLLFDEEKKEFTTEFKNLPRNFLQHLHEAGFLNHILPELFPDTFSGKIIINPQATKNEETHVLCFYLEMTATEEMKERAARRRKKNNHNRSIIIYENEKLKFEVTIGKTSGYFKEDTPEKIVFCF